MSGAKIQLSREERELLADPDIILTKNRILASMIDLLGTVSEEETAMAERLRDRLPAGFFKMHPKISRGENYFGLPWLMLDYPRNFDPENMLAIRQFCWWGNFYSSTLLVSGQFIPKLLANIGYWPLGSMVCLQDSPWDNRLEKEAVLLVTGKDDDEIKRVLTGKKFLMLSLKRPILEWEGVGSFYLDGFRSWLGLLSD